VPTPWNWLGKTHPFAVVVVHTPVDEQQAPRKSVRWQKVVEVQAVPDPL